MKNFALKIIRNNYVELARSEGIKKLPKDLLLDILVDMSNLFEKTKQSGNNSPTSKLNSAVSTVSLIQLSSSTTTAQNYNMSAVQTPNSMPSST